MNVKLNLIILELVFFKAILKVKLLNIFILQINFTALIINAGALTHTSIAIHDALKLLKKKKLKFIYQTFILGKNLKKIFY